MERTLIDDYIECKMDLEAVSTLLNEVYDKEKESLQRRANYTSNVGKMLYEKEEERFYVLTTCKENLDFVIDVLKEYINQNTQDSNTTTLSYKPRVLTYHSDIGKYQTEVLKVKRIFETLVWKSSFPFARNEEKMRLYKDCVEKLKYVYSHIS